MNMSEKAIQNKIIKDLKAKGYWVIKTQGGVAGTPIGTPDIIACDPTGKFLAIEVKKIGGKISDEQIYQTQKLSSNWAYVYVTNDINFVSIINKTRMATKKTIINFNTTVTYMIRDTDFYEVTT